MTNREVALLVGKSEKTINMLYSKYKIPPRDRRVSQADVAEVARLNAAGLSRKQIAAETGHAVSTVRACLIRAGIACQRHRMEEPSGPPGPLAIVEPARPKAFRASYCGRPYIDVTDFFAPR